jgi:3-oxoacyl-[acyl-carrier-protein] synthase II
VKERVVITGSGAIGPFGAGVAPLMEAVVAGRTAVEGAGRACAAPLRDAVDAGPIQPNVWRRLDRCSRMTVASACEALRDSGFRSPAEQALVLGTMTAGVATLRAFLATQFAEGPESASPTSRERAEAAPPSS